MASGTPSRTKTMHANDKLLVNLNLIARDSQFGCRDLLRTRAYALHRAIRKLIARHHTTLARALRAWACCIDDGAH